MDGGGESRTSHRHPATCAPVVLLSRGPRGEPQERVTEGQLVVVAKVCC